MHVIQVAMMEREEINIFNIDLAQKIAEETARICGHSISIMDSKGLIIGSDNVNRINTYHEGLEPIFNEKKYIAHNEEEVKQIKGAYAGMAFPIIVNEEVIGALGILGNPEEIIKYAQLVKHQVEMMFQQELYFEISRMKSDALEIFIKELISDEEYSDEQHLERLAEINGYSLNVTRFATVIEIQEDPNNRLSEDIYVKKLKSILESIQTFFNDGQTISSMFGSKGFFIFPTIEGNRQLNNQKLQIEEIQQLIAFLFEKYNIRCIVGIGNHYDGIAGLRKSYSEANRVMSIARKAQLPYGVYHIEGLCVERILSEVATETIETLLKKSFVTKLLEKENEYLKLTFLTLCQNDLNLSQTAKKLHVHRNTLLYRVNRIHLLTGFNPTKFQDAMTLFLLLKLKGFLSQ